MNFAFKTMNFALNMTDLALKMTDLLSKMMNSPCLGEDPEGLAVRPNHEFCIKYKELCIKNQEFCIENTGFCIQNDGLCRYTPRTSMCNSKNAKNYQQKVVVLGL